MTQCETSVGEILVRMGKLSRPMLEVALARQESTGGFLGDVLVKQMGVVTQEDLDRAVNSQHDFRSGRAAEAMADIVMERFERVMPVTLTKVMSR